MRAGGAIFKAAFLLAGGLSVSCTKIDELGSRFFAKSGAAKAVGTVTGLAGLNLTLSVNGETGVVASSTAEIATGLKNGDTYTLAISTQPQGPQQLCSFTSETTGVASGGVIPFAISCTTGTHTVAGSITGLAGTGLQLQLNDGEILAAGGSSFAFNTRITDGQAFNVQVKQQPSSPVQICTPQYNVGVIAGANVSNVSILCSTVPYSVGGYVNGLASGGSVTVQINGGQNTARTSDGFFLFPTPLADQTHYDVTVLTQPTGQTCSVQSGSGALDGRGSYATYIHCASAAWTVSGTVTGLSGGYVTLVTSAGEYKPIVANGAFSFSQKFASGSAYAVEVFRNPALPAQTCTVMNGTGTNITADVGSVSVTCSAVGYTIGGSLTGLTASGLVLRLNGTSDLIVPVGSSSYAFGDAVASGGTYTVAVASQPTGLKCTVTPATQGGTVASANVTNVAVTCQTGYTVGGTVTGLNGTNLVLRNTVNGGAVSDFVISGSSFTFPELLVNTDTYSVDIRNHPESPYQTCGISNSGGTITNANISNVTVSCTNVTVQFSAASSNAAEASATVDIPITISPASARPLNLTLALAAGTAAAGVDFNFLTPAINVPVGATSVNAQVQVFGDATYEPNETVIINLTGVDKAALGTTLNHTYTINNDDGVTATKIVVTNSGNNFTAGGTTSITVQVQDASNNLATTDNSTQITFSPTGSGRISAVTTGTGDGGYGIAGGAEMVTVSGGVATVTIANTVAQTFQVAVTNNAALTNPSNISLTASAGTATQVVITSAAPDTIAGATTSLTVQVQDANGNLVTGASTLITFTPTASGAVSGVTTGTGDGSYGVAAGSESVTVSGGVATITLTNNTAQTFQVAITNNGGLSNPANDSVTILPAAASQVVLTTPGSSFITGGTTTLTVKVQDSFGNVRTSDSSTQITFSPTNSGKITAVGAGTGDGGYNVVGGAESVTVASGVATVTIGNSVSETFQVAFTNNGGLSNPSPRSLTASVSATQVVITQAGVDFIVGGSTTLTVQVQTSGGSLVTGDNTTQITFDPTNSGVVTGVTTGTGDGSYGVAGGAEVVTVAGGVATITLSDSVAETFQVAIANNAALSNPANDSITVTNATGAVITKAEYFDTDHNGKIDRVKITFDKNVDETTLTGYNASGTDVSTQFLIAGYSGVTMRHNQCIDQSYPTNGNCTDAGELTDTTTNSIVWLEFAEGALPDTGATPNITGVDVSLRTTAALGACYIHTTGGNCNTQTSADFGTAAVVEEDKAPPVYVTAWSDPIVDAWQLRIQFSEAVDLTSAVGCSGTVTGAAFTYNNVGGSGASALRTDFADNNGCDSTGGYYYITPRVNARFTMNDLRTDTLALATTFYDAVGLATVAATKTIQYDPNLELYYPMDAGSPVSDTNSTVKDIAVHSPVRDGTVSNGAKLVKDMTDSNNQSYYFDGNDDRIVPAAFPALGTGNFTVSSWIRLSDAVRTGRIHQIMYWGTAAANQRASFQVTAGKLKLELNGGANVTSTKYIADGWHHVAVAYNGTNAQLYIDGVADASAAMSPNLTANSPGVGYNPGSPTTETALGKLDEVRLYSRALSATEIRKLATKVPGGAIVHYPTERWLDVVKYGAGTTDKTIDITGNDHDLGTGLNDPSPAQWRYGDGGTNTTSYSYTNEMHIGNPAQLNLANKDLTFALFINAVNNGETDHFITLGLNAGYENISIRKNTNNSYQFCFDACATETVSSGALSYEWHHFAGSLNATTREMKFYVDGSLVGTTIAGSAFIGDNSLRLGAGRTGFFGAGRLNDVRFYDRILTAGEVAALATELDRGLVSYYPLDDAAATAKDYSGSGNDLTAVNGPTYVADRNGITNSAFSFNSASTQYLTLSSAAGLPQGAAERTVCAWVQGGASQQSVVSHGGTAAVSIFNLKVHTNYSGPAVTNSQINAGVESPLARANNGWYHMCGKIDSSNTAIIVNGNSESSSSTGMNSTGTELRIGANTLNGTPWNGQIDDVRIYNRALSTAEIRAMSGFYPAHLSTLAVWYDASRLADTGNTNPAEGSDVSLWKDLSLNNRFADKSGASSSKPKFRNNVINALPTVRFTAADGQRMDINNYPRNLNTTAHTQLVAFRASGGAAGAITSQSSGHNIFLYNAGPVLQSQIGGTYRSANTPYVDNSFVIAGLTYANPTGMFYRNGASDGTFSATAQSSTNAWRFGDASSALNGDVGELIIYDRVLTAAELEKVNCYYSRKYAIAVTGLVCE